jgi:tetratricopeptide (TPR) repeat protein
VDAVLRVLGNVTGSAGTLLLLDDLQWAGGDALDLLTTLARSAGQVPLRVVGAYRDSEIEDSAPLATLLSDLAHGRLARQVTLGPLAPPEAAALLEPLLGEGEDAARVARHTGGVPFFLLSYADAQRAGWGTLGGDDVPWDVAQSVRHRFAALPPAAREVLSTAALIGRVVPCGLLMAVLDLPERDILTGLEPALRARLMAGTEGQQTLRFAHDVIREALEADVPVVRRLALHRTIAAALERQAAEVGGDLPLETLAYHWGRSGDQEKAAHYAEQAGDRAWAQYAHAAAEGHFRDLVERLEGLGWPRDGARAREKLAAVHIKGARFTEALAVLEPAVDAYTMEGDSEGLRRVLAQMGEAHALPRTAEAGLARLLPLLDALDPGHATAGWAALHLALTNLFFSRGHASEHVAAAARAVELSRALGDQDLLAVALERHGYALMVQAGHRAEARAVVEEACRVADAAGNLDIICWAELDAEEIALDGGAFAAADRCLTRALRAAEQQGDPWQIAVTLCFRGRVAYYRGDWAAARRDILEAQSKGAQLATVSVDAHAFMCLLHLGRLCLAEGDWQAARRCLEESASLVEREGPTWHLSLVHCGVAELDLEEGRPAAALARLTALLERPEARNLDVHELWPIVALAHLEMGHLAEAAAAVSQAIDGMRSDDNLLNLVDALRVQALIAIRQVDWALAERALDEGLTHARRMPYPYAEARLLHAYGQLHLQRDERAAARGRLEEALTIFERLGARRHALQVAQSLQ